VAGFAVMVRRIQCLNRWCSNIVAPLRDKPFVRFVGSRNLGLWHGDADPDFRLLHRKPLKPTAGQRMFWPRATAAFAPAGQVSFCNSLIFGRTLHKRDLRDGDRPVPGERREDVEG
jgi:hypothetical protein